MPKKNRKNKVQNYRIAVIDNDSHKQLWSFKTGRGGFFVALVSLLAVVFALMFLLLAFTPAGLLLPENAFGKAGLKDVRNAMKIDSLENVIRTWSFYSENLKRVLEGGDPIPIDSIIRNSAAAETLKYRPEELGRQDSLLRQQVAETEQFVLQAGKERKLPIEGKHFFTPLKGVVSQEYQATLHPYIDITAPANSVVLAALAGTVIHAGWSDEAGYTLEIQHADDLITVYKHNQKLLKEVGDKVTAGTPVALVGNTGSLTTGDHLHFELWYRGEAVDPTRYIKF